METQIPFVAAKRERLSDVLRERTADVHLTAERTGIMNDILKQKAGREGYALLLRNLLPAYENMEKGLQQHRYKVALRVFARPDLARALAIRNDLTQIAGDDFETSLPLLDVGARYADRIASIADDDSIRLISHAYVRYLGDLSGGQILKKLLAKSMALPSEALTLYDFPNISDQAAFKNELRSAIDDAAEIASDPEDLISEALTAFEHNIAISKAIQELVGTASKD